MVRTQQSIPQWKGYANAALQAELKGDAAEAEENYRLSIEFAHHSPLTTEEDEGEALINLADFLTARKRYEEAEEHYRRAIEIYERLFGSDNLIAEMIYRVLAEIYVLQEQSLQVRLLDRRRHAG